MIKTGTPQLTINNKSFRAYPEVLNSVNKNASNEMLEYLHDKIQKHAM